MTLGLTPERSSVLGHEGDPRHNRLCNAKPFCNRYLDKQQQRQTATLYLACTSESIMPSWNRITREEDFTDDVYNELGQRLSSTVHLWTSATRGVKETYRSGCNSHIPQ